MCVCVYTCMCVDAQKSEDRVGYVVHYQVTLCVVVMFLCIVL